MSRNYACIFTPSETLIGHYIALIHAFKDLKSYSTPFQDINNVQKDHLELYIKKIGVFSKFLHDFPFSKPEELNGPKNDFQIRGPFVTASKLFIFLYALNREQELELKKIKRERLWQ